MSNNRPPITVFTKPWPALPIEELADHIARLGFDGIELPVRPGFQVEPDEIDRTLATAARAFEDRGAKIYSVASELSERALTACGDAGVAVLRTMLPLNPDLGYMENVEAFRSQCEKLASVAKSAGVSIGLQNHCDRFACSSLSIMHAIEPLDRESASAVLDLGHTGLEGEGEDIAIDIAWPRLSMINLKNGIRVKDGVEPDGSAIWKRTWVSGKEGFTSWRKAIAELSKRGYRGPICITGEYKRKGESMMSGDSIIPFLKDDLEYLNQLLDEYYA